MMDEQRRDERFAALALAAAVVMLPPFLGVFNTDALVLGIPLLFLYLFTVWGIVIVLAAVLTRGKRLSHPGGAPPVGLAPQPPDREGVGAGAGAEKTGGGRQSEEG